MSDMFNAYRTDYVQPNVEEKSSDNERKISYLMGEVNSLKGMVDRLQKDNLQLKQSVHHMAAAINNFNRAQN